jgi:hypothetical protein
MPGAATTAMLGLLSRRTISLMTGRRIRRLLLFAAAAGIAYWVYKDRPTISGIVDTLTSPLMESKAAVKSSEHKRVEGDAATAISEQVDLPVGSLHEGMTGTEVQDLMGRPDKIEKEKQDGIERIRWTYQKAGRIVVFSHNRVVSIIVK